MAMMSTTFLSSKTSSAVRGVAPLRASANATRTNMIFKAATKPKAKKVTKSDNSGNWTLKRTIAEKKPADIVQNFGDGVQFGGFTKANELFSGRLAMLGLQLWETEDLLLLQIGVIGALAFTGFASGGQPFRDLYPEDAQNLYSPKDGEKFWRQVFGLAEEGPVFGFNTNNELLLGRVAMTGFAVTTLIEAVSGRGPLEQLGFELGASSLHFEEDFFLASAAFFAVSAVFPRRWQACRACLASSLTNRLGPPTTFWCNLNAHPEYIHVAHRIPTAITITSTTL